MSNLKSSSELDLSHVDDVLAYLEGTPYASTSAVPLSGGTANFIFRLYLKTPLTTARGARTVILKHAKSWVASNKAFQLDVERQRFEALALRHVHAFLPADSLVTVPAVHLHDPEAHVLIMEDAGSDARNLKDLLRKAPLNESSSRDLGAALGQFLAAVHVHGSADSVLLEGVQDNEDSRRITVWITYGRLVDMLRQLGQGTDFVDPLLTEAEMPSEAQIAEIAKLAEATIQKIYNARTAFTMGDFWTGNVVVRLTEDGDIARAFVIDWEISKPGLAFIDFAQFTAEMHTLRRFHPEADASVRTALEAYGRAYKQTVRINEEFIRSAAAHVGAHMITVTPSIASWGSKEKTREVVKEGIEYLLGGLRGEAKWLRTSAIGSLISSDSI